MRTNRFLAWVLLVLTSTAAMAQLAGVRIGVDPGHGGAATGAIGPTGLMEKSVNLSTALRLQAYLQADGATVYITRTADVDVSFAARTNYFISNGVALGVSVHHNQGASSADTTMDFAYCGLCDSAAGILGSRIVQRLGASTQLPIGIPAAQATELCSAGTFLCDKAGVGQADLVMVRDPSQVLIPAILAEVSFISNPTEETRLRNSDYIDGNGWAIYAGIADYRGVTPKPRGGSGTGTIQVNATLDGSPWPTLSSSGALGWQVGGTRNLSGNVVPTTLIGEPPGGYTIQYVSGGPTGGPPSGITPPLSQTLTAGGTIVYTFNFSSGGTCGAGSVVCPPPLSVALAATPTSGNAPLNGVSFSASVTGSAQTINYTFYCNRADTGVNITTPYDAKINSTYTNPLTLQNVCSYNTPGIYYAKVIAEQGTGQAQSQAIISVGQPSPICYPLTLARNNSGGGGLPTASPANSPGCTTGQYTAGQNIQLSASPASGWSVGWWNGTQNDGSTSTINSSVMPASSAFVNVNYVYIPPTGGVRVDGTLDGVSWSGPVSFSLQGPSNYTGNWVTTLGNGLLVGNYALFYNGGGPPGASLTSITPSSYQYLAQGGGIAFAFNFSTPAGYPINLVTGTADSITQTSAVLHGSANPNGASTSAYFILYGPYPYPRLTSNSVNIGSAKADQNFAIRMDGLSCGTTYEYTADAINALGESNGDFPTFDTASCTTASSSTLFYTLTPCRIIDTRNNGLSPLGASSGVTVAVTGSCGVPATAKAVALNVTAVNPTAAGFLSVYPAIGVPPSGWSVAVRQGTTRAAGTIIGLSPYGTLTVYNSMTSGQTDFLLDVTGYFQ